MGNLDKVYYRCARCYQVFEFLNTQYLHVSIEEATAVVLARNYHDSLCADCYRKKVAEKVSSPYRDQPSET